LLLCIGIHQRADHTLVRDAALAGGSLEKRPERCDRLSVTFTLFSRSTNLSGDGRKSSTILTRPISPLLYLAFGLFTDRRLPSISNDFVNLPVMPALVAGIHVFLPPPIKGVDGRVKPGHDEEDRLPLHFPSA
jgi:hypothetical protein